MRFRKKPIVIEAFQLKGNEFTHWPDFMRIWAMRDGAVCLLINTLEGEMIARQDDWIIKGVKGEFYPCKPDIFAATYEAVTE